MARYGILTFPYEVGQALIAWSLQDWHVFNGWAVEKGVSLLSLPAHEYVDLYYRFFTRLFETRDQYEAFDKELEKIGDQTQRERITPPTPTTLQPEDEEPKEKKGVIAEPGKSWQTTDPNWRPPGWLSDEDAMRNATSFMSAQASGWKK